MKFVFNCLQKEEISGDHNLLVRDQKLVFKVTGLDHWLGSLVRATVNFGPWFCFKVLIGITSSGKPLRGFVPKELLPAECLSSLVGLLSASNVKPNLIIKAMVLLFNLGEL